MKKTFKIFLKNSGRFALVMSCLVFFASVLLADGVRAFPNPWVPSDRSGRRGNLADGITFDRLPLGGGELRIYNSAGQLVRNQRWLANQTETEWLGKNNSSQYVASGVYIWIINPNSGARQNGRIVVIR
ncbi:MAG: gliding motility-associated C-terminal domain-containing protein [Elusimicrobia bacterium]|nr:gliding motility-associated C-terminal domain-containing protein [Elusimicrobiota bacterium]